MIELQNNRIDRTKTSCPPISDLGGKKMLFSSAIANMHAVISIFLRSELVISLNKTFPEGYHKNHGCSTLNIKLFYDI